MAETCQKAQLSNQIRAHIFLIINKNFAIPCSLFSATSNYNSNEHEFVVKPLRRSGCESLNNVILAGAVLESFSIQTLNEDLCSH